MGAFQLACSDQHMKCTMVSQTADEAAATARGQSCILSARCDSQAGVKQCQSPAPSPCRAHACPWSLAAAEAKDSIIREHTLHCMIVTASGSDMSAGMDSDIVHKVQGMISTHAVTDLSNTANDLSQAYAML